MVQDLKFAGQGNTGLFQILERPHDVTVFHVPHRIVIGADNQETRMATAGGLDEQMQIAVIVVVSCQQKQTVLDCVK